MQRNRCCVQAGFCCSEQWMRVPDLCRWPETRCVVLHALGQAGSKLVRPGALAAQLQLGMRQRSTCVSSFSFTTCTNLLTGTASRSMLRASRLRLSKRLPFRWKNAHTCVLRRPIKVLAAYFASGDSGSERVSCKGCAKLWTAAA